MVGDVIDLPVKLLSSLQNYDSATASITNLGQSTYVDFIPGEDELESGDPKAQPGGNLWDYMYNLKRYLV